MAERLLVALTLVAATLAIALAARAWARWRANRSVGRPAPAALRRRLADLGPTVVYFYGPHCGSCAHQSRALHQLEEAEGTPVLRLDATEEPEVASALGIATVPSTAVIDLEGRVRWVNLGYRSRDTILAQLREARPPTPRGLRPQGSARSSLGVRTRP